MLHEFLTANKAELVQRYRLRVTKRLPPNAAPAAWEHEVPRFLDLLTKTLQDDQTSEPQENARVSRSPGGSPSASEIAATSCLHGRESAQKGFNVDQIVYDYGDLCQTITTLAVERGSLINAEEFRTLNCCLDNGIADAVTEYVFQHDAMLEAKSTNILNEKFGHLAHELRNLIQTATLAVKVINSGNVGTTGATGAMLDRTLVSMRHLIDRSLADVRLTAGMPSRAHLISLADFVADATMPASLEALSRGCTLTVGDIDRDLALNVDRELLLSAVGNLLQNALKFTHPHTEIKLNAYSAADRIRLDVEDHCGGLPGTAEDLFQPFKQNGQDRSGLGLGLAICRRSVEANGGTLKVRNVPGSGCVFTIDLPRHVLPGQS